MATVRLTAAQALVRFLAAQRVERDGVERRFFGGCFGIFGHGNVAGIGQAGKSTVYVRKRDPKIDTEPQDQYNQFVAISTRCMHLGCPVRFVEAAGRFICPCHGGVYNFRGEVDGGPPVRPLDRFYTRTRNGQVEIGPRYSVNSELKRFSPRDPGETLDGIGPYLYPSRPTVRKLPGT